MARSTEYVKKHREKVKAAGGKRLTLVLPSQVVDALDAVMSQGRHKSQNDAIAAAIMAYADDSKGASDLLTRVAFLEKQVGILSEQYHTIITANFGGEAMDDSPDDQAPARRKTDTR